MPTTQVVKTRYHYPSTLFQAFLNQFAGTWQAGEYDGFPAIWEAVYDGTKPALKVTQFVGFPDYFEEVYILFEETSETARITPRMLLTFPGASQTISSGNFASGIDASYLTTQWEAFTDKVAAFLTITLSSVLVNKIDTTIFIDSTSNQYNCQTVIKVTSDGALAMYLQLGVVVIGQTVDVGPPYVYNYVQNDMPSMSAIGQGSDAVRQLGRIADAQEDIANSDPTISLNHGQAVYSINSKVLTGE